MYGSGGREGCRLGGGDDEGGGGEVPQPQIPRGPRDDEGGPGSAGGAHSGGMDSCLRRNDGGVGGSIKEFGFGVDCLWGAGTVVDCLVSRGGFRPPGHAIGVRGRRTFGICDLGGNDGGRQYGERI